MPLQDGHLIVPDTGRLFITPTTSPAKVIKKNKKKTQTKFISFSKSSFAQSFAALPYNSELRVEDQLISVYFPDHGPDWYVGSIVAVRKNFVWVQFWGDTEHTKVFDRLSTYSKFWSFVHQDCRDYV